MAKDFVWAIDEDGKPTKCTAKPENRGKRRCKHRFHARPGEDKASFFERYSIAEEDVSYEYNIVEHVPYDSLPNYNEIIKDIIPDINKKYDSWSDVMQSAINSSYLNNGGIGFLDASDITGDPGDKVEVNVVSDEVDPDNPENVKMVIEFDYHGEKHVESFSIPKVDELGEFSINGSKYRCIPVIEYKKGVEVSREGNLKLKDDDNNIIVTINKDSDEAKIAVYEYNEELGRIVKDNQKVPVEEIDKYMSGKPNNLTEAQKKSIDGLDNIVRERYAEIGMDGLTKLPPDDLNDISYRHIATYEDRVKFTISKKLKSLDSVYRKRIRNGGEQDFTLSNITENIKKDLLTQSCVRLSEDLNPISALSQSQRLTYCGPGAYKSDMLPEQIRFTHESYYDLIDNNDVSLGGNIGSSVALRGGFISEDSVIRPNGKNSKDMLSCSDFIPFKEHSDPNRGTMAVSQMRQAVPIVGGEDPIISTKGWDRIKGSKLGVNLKVAYLPESGVWEDAVVLSESAARKMTTTQKKKYQTSKKPKHSVGDRVNKGDRVGDTVVEYSGVIRSVSDTSFEVETTYPMTVGDKLAGRYGNKGVVSKILPDDKMPKDEDGSPTDIIMSPIGIAGRSNLGQVYEVNGGAGIVNKTRKVSYKGRTVDATCGTQFVMRLNQIAEKKMHSTSNNRNGEQEFKTRFGEMENILLSSSEKRLSILNYLKNQETNHGEQKLKDTLKSIGVDIKPRS